MLKLYSKQELAQLMNLSYKTLRVYEEKGLIHPDYINPQNGYKYYSEKQIYTIDMIRYSNAELDISLAEIKSVLSNSNQSSALIELLQQKKENIEAMLTKYQMIMENIEHSLDFNSKSKELFQPYTDTMKQTYSYIEFHQSIDAFIIWNTAQQIYEYMGHKRFNFLLQTDVNKMDNIKRIGVLHGLPPVTDSNVFQQEVWNSDYLCTAYRGYSNFSKAVETLIHYAGEHQISLDTSACYLEYHTLDISTLTHEDTIIHLKIKIKN